MKTKTLFRFALLALICCTIPFTNAAMAGDGSGQTVPVSVFTTPGLYPLAEKWAGEYSGLHPDRQIKVVRAEGAELAELAGKSGQVGLISGNDLAALTQAPAWQVIVGRDVIVPVINASNPFVAEISVKGISPAAFAGSISNPDGLKWGTLLKNGEKSPLHYYIVNDQPAVSQVAAFLNTDPEKTALLIYVTGAEMAAAIRQDPCAVGFCRLTDILAANGRDLAENIRLLPIDKNGNGKLDYMEQIYDNTQTFSRGVWIGKYPKALTTDLFLVSSVQPAGEAPVGFLSWVLTEGQPLQNEFGYSNLVIDERQTQLDKLSTPSIAATPEAQATSYQKYLLWGLAALLVAGFMLDRLGRRIRRSQAAAREHVKASVTGFDEHSVIVPKGLYFDKTHTWAFMEPDGTVKTGIDDFLKHVTGPVTRIEMKNPGERISKGDPLLTIIQQGKKLVLYSPVSGIVKAQNRELAANPSLLHTSPGADGWLYRIEPANWIRETQFLSMGENYRIWLAGEFSRLKDFLAVALRANDAQYSHVVLQDGGNLKESLLSELSPEVWEEFQTKFLDSCK